MSNLIDITPPESFHKAPLTPPPNDEETPSKQVLNIIQCLELQLAGQRPLSSPGKVFHLAHRDFDHLLKTLELDQPLWRYFQTKVRYAAHPRSRTLPLILCGEQVRLFLPSRTIRPSHALYTT